MNLNDLFDLSFIGRRDAVALEFGNQTLTFGEIDERSNRVAHLFQQRGLQAGDRLCVYLANCVEMIDVYGLGNGLHTWLIAGCRMRLLERFERDTAAATFLEFQPTLFFGVPTIFVRLLDTPPNVARKIGSSMRLFVSGSAPLPAQVLQDFQALFGHVILERYGLTETFMNISNPDTGERRPGKVGLPRPGVSVK